MRVVLITGGCGFLGRYFAEHHVAQGDQVVIVDDLSAEGSSSDWIKWPARFVEADAGSFFAVDAGGFDLAYHFAAPVGGRVKIEGDPLFNADSLRLDSAFFRWAAHGGAETCVYPSSSAAYGTTFQRADSHATLREPMFEPFSEAAFSPDEIYGLTKFVGEHLAKKAAGYGVNTLCIRPFSGYGERQSFDYPFPSIVRRAVRREDPLVVWGSSYQVRDFIHVSDVVEATVQRLRHPVNGYVAMNIGRGIPVTFRELAELAAEVVGYKPTIQIDDTKPEGVSWRVCDPTYMRRFWAPKIHLRDGVERMVRWLDAEDASR
jgi:UDP-glucose 4-epimerase